MPRICEREATIYSLDIIERIAELEKLVDESAISWDQRTELLELLLLQNNFHPASEFFSGLTLINSKNFENYMDEFIRDSHEIPELPRFMVLTLDYEALKMDYTAVEFRGQTFFTQP